MNPDQAHIHFDFAAILLFFIVGVIFVEAALWLGKLIRPAVKDESKSLIYECGEPTIGTSWIRYNIRFYTIALVFLIFDVEVVFLFPVILVLREIGWTAFFEVFFFISILVMGLVYAWRFGNLDWIRSGEITRPLSADEPSAPPEEPPLRESAFAAEEESHA